MMLISFAMTTEAFLAGKKTVTRRRGWDGLCVGERLMAVEKCQGLKKGERVRRLGVIEIVSVRRERLDAITAADVKREGYGATAPSTFVSMFCKAMGCLPSDQVARIEFKKVRRRS